MRAIEEEQREGANGIQIITFENGDIWEGQVDNDGLPHGNGIMKSSIGTYEGEFKNGEKEGKGVLQYADGTVYEG